MFVKYNNVIVNLENLRSIYILPKTDENSNVRWHRSKDQIVFTFHGTFVADVNDNNVSDVFIEIINGEKGEDVIAQIWEYVK